MRKEAVQLIVNGNQRKSEDSHLDIFFYLGNFVPYFNRLLGYAPQHETRHAIKLPLLLPKSNIAKTSLIYGNRKMY